ncbi:MAG: prenyltransferase/squalene oxidase repeat-containing protein [Methanoregula sp.]
MSIKWPIGILFIIACLTGVCAFFVLNTATPASHESWNAKTVEKIGYSHAPDGGYADFAPDDPDLYSTYYFSLALKNEHIDLMQKEQTHRWLYSLEQEFIANSSRISLKDVYYLTGCMKNYDILPQNRSGITYLVAQFRQPDGSYADRPEFNGSSLDTMRALEILEFAGNNTVIANATREWLVQQWKRDQISPDEDYVLAETQVLVPALSLAEIDPDKILSNSSQKNIQAPYAGRWVSRLEDLPGKKIDLFTLNALEREVRMSGKLTSQITQKIQDYIYSLELPDGGYNAILGNYGESQGTYLAAKMLTDIGCPVHNQTIDFILRHQSRYGGFRPAFKITPSQKDTWFAIRALALMDPDNPAIPSVKPWLDAQMDNPGLSSENQYYVVMTYGELKETVPDAAALRNTIKQRITTVSGSAYEQGDMEEIFHLLNIAKILDLPLEPAQRDHLIQKVNELQNTDGGYGRGGSDLMTTYFALGSLDALSATPLNPEACASWIGQGYTDDGGYRYRRGDRSSNFSYVSPTYLSVSSLTYLHKYPATADTTLQWINNSKYSGGGIQLMPEKPETEVNDVTFRENLEYTVQGLETERILQHRAGFP